MSWQRHPRTLAPSCVGAAVYSRCVRGRRADLDGFFFRSAWEANYARYLRFLVAHGVLASWRYEPKTFWFDGIRRGCLSYLPDFEVVKCDGTVEYHEVKGWMDANSRTKLDRMARYHPDVRVVLVDREAYRGIERAIGRGLPGWEVSR